MAGITIAGITGITGIIIRLGIVFFFCDLKDHGKYFALFLKFFALCKFFKLLLDHEKLCVDHKT